MTMFPSLNSGAVCQYPVEIFHQQGVQVLRYLDGTDQRFLRQGRQFRRWQIQLELLSEPELFTLEQFFQSQLGQYSKFSFLDPFTNSLVPNCCFGNQSLMSEVFGLGNGSTSLWVIETNV